MWKKLVRFLRDENGQDFAEYALLLGAIGAIALAVISTFKDSITAGFNKGIEAMDQAVQ